MVRISKARLAVVFLNLILLTGCEDLLKNGRSLLDPNLQRSEVIGFLAGIGTTFAVLPDLITMLRRRSSGGMKPRMAAITGVFQILWIYYGLLIVSRPVVLWNLIAMLINLACVAAYRHFSRKEKNRGSLGAEAMRMN